MNHEDRWRGGRSQQRARPGNGRHDSDHVYYQEAHSTADGPARRRRDAGAAVARRDGAGGDGAGADGGERRSRGSSACFVPHGGAPGYWVPETAGPLAAELPFNWKPLEPFREADRDLQRPAFALGRAAAGRDRRRSLGGGGVHVRRKPKKTAGADVSCRHDHRPDHRAEDRQRQPDAVAADGGRRSGRQLEQLRRGLQLRLHEHDLVGVADLAAADGAEPAGGVRADVRRRQHGRAARRAAQARPEHSRLAERQPDAAARRRQRRRSRAARRVRAERPRDRAPAADRHEGVDRGAGEHRRCRSACRRPSTSTSSCSSTCWRWRSRPTSRASARCSSRAT